MIFNKYPREIGPPRKMVYDRQEYLKYVNLYNGKKKAIYSSIYKFNSLCYDPYIKPIYESAEVDKIYFDFDDKSCNAYKMCNILHQRCIGEGLKHTIIFSGRGYHLYIYTKIKEHKFKKEAIRGAQNYFINQLNLIVDKQVIGNVAQMARVPNTYHIKAKRFCIPLSRIQFEMGDKYIKELAEKQQFIKQIFIGFKLLDISKWDVVSNEEWIDMSKIKCDIKVDDGDVEIKNVPPCIQRLLNKESHGWKDRYLIILYFKEKGFMREEIFKVLEKYLSPRKLRHCIKDERQLQYLYGRDDLMFPTCENLMKDGICDKKCKDYGCVVYK